MDKYTVTVDQPNRPKGDPIEVPPVGVISNGDSVTTFLDEDTYNRFKESGASSGISVKKGGGGTVDLTEEPEPEITVVGSEPDNEEGGEEG